MHKGDFTVSGFKPRHSKNEHRADRGKKHSYPKTRRKRTYSKPKADIMGLPLNVYLHIPLRSRKPTYYKIIYFNKKSDGVNTKIDTFNR